MGKRQILLAPLRGGVKVGPLIGLSKAATMRRHWAGRAAGRGAEAREGSGLKCASAGVGLCGLGANKAALARHPAAEASKRGETVFMTVTIPGESQLIYGIKAQIVCVVAIKRKFLGKFARLARTGARG